MGWIPQNNDNLSPPCTYNANVDDAMDLRMQCMKWQQPITDDNPQK